MGWAGGWLQCCEESRQICNVTREMNINQPTRTEQIQCMFQEPSLDAKLRHCKLKIEKCKLKIKEWYTSAESQKRGTANLQFAFFNFQFSISPLFAFTFQLLMDLTLVASASSQNK